MKHLIFIMTWVFIAQITLAQEESSISKKAAKQFEEHFNAGEFDKIFSMYSPEMKKAIPLDQTQEFLQNIKAQAGNIIKREFIKYENGSVALYKTNFQFGLLALRISTDNNGLVNGFLVKEYVEERLPAIERNITPMKLPFKGEWTVFWGGDTPELNYHVQNRPQKNAFDIIMLGENGRSFKTDGSSNEDFYAFGQELLAPCDGEVVLVVDGIKDNVPGNMNPTYIPGNTVIIKTTNDEYLFFAHFKQHSIQVKQGQKVKQGQLLGLCGNSGNSSEPHLHFHIQNLEDMNMGTGIKCHFDDLLVNGETKTDYSPVKGDKVKAANQ